VEHENEGRHFNASAPQETQRAETKEENTNHVQSDEGTFSKTKKLKLFMALQVMWIRHVGY
jgi:hypothetical protein